MTYFLKIFGCQMNYSDAERISTILTKYKMKPAASTHEADLVVFVTCGVRQMAEDRVYGQIHNIRKKYPRKKIVLTGCLAHRKDVQRRLKDKINLFVPIEDFPKEIKKISRHSGTPLRRWLVDTRYQLPDTETKPCNNYLQLTPKYANSYTAYIPVMTGCNNFCSYCVVPYARGREYSRPAEDILNEVKRVVKNGYREIILLGQNVNSYKNLTPSLSLIRRGIEEEVNFPKLLKQIENIPGRFWLTFITSHPKDMSDELIEMIAQNKKICEYISLPAQSGDNEILRKMNRKYTIAHYKNLIKKIRSAYKGLTLRNFPTNSRERERSNLGWELSPAISTDIIVGFPGESRKQFENTAKLFREMKFDMAYVNQYSPRPETAAWQLKNNVSKKEKDRREKILNDILSKTALANNRKYVGKIVEVLVEKRFKKLGFEEFQGLSSWKGKSRALDSQKYLAHTRTQKKVIFHSNKKIPVGTFAKVKITKAKAFGLEGKIK